MHYWNSTWKPFLTVFKSRLAHVFHLPYSSRHMLTCAATTSVSYNRIESLECVGLYYYGDSVKSSIKMNVI